MFKNVWQQTTYLFLLKLLAADTPFVGVLSLVQLHYNTFPQYSNFDLENLTFLTNSNTHTFFQN